VTKKSNSKSKDWISPIGQTATEAHERWLAKRPDYRERWERNRPYREIAHKVIFRRADLGLSQAQLARRIGTTKSGISRIESGRHRTSLRTLERLAEALEMELVIDFTARPKKKPASRTRSRKKSAKRPARTAA
jgi:ribosome-binding protein aMBF1 (putative translation factor)